MIYIDSIQKGKLMRLRLRLVNALNLDLLRMYLRGEFELNDDEINRVLEKIASEDIE